MNDILNTLNLDDLVGQLLCYEILNSDTPEEFEEICRKTHPGGIFISSGATPERIKLFTEIANRYSKVPVIVAGDVENGPGCVLKDFSMHPQLMACGASDDAKLIEKISEETAKIVRKNGIHLALSPVVDINVNPSNPVVNTRAFSDSANHVAKMGASMVRGMQKNGYVACTCKHFPGDGIDDRNQHFCTSINNLSFQNWMETFGYVYKTMIDEDVACVMAAHIALPSYDEEMQGIKGYRPSVLSHKLMNDLLKGQLEFDGCIISDAMSMIGACAMTNIDHLAVEFIVAGGDMVLFPESGDFEQIKAAVLRGEISRARLEDAVKRILKLKQRVRLFEDQEKLQQEIEYNDFQILSDAIGEKSIKIVRDEKGILPLSLKPGNRVLIVNLLGKRSSYEGVLSTLAEELNSRGIETTELFNCKHKQIQMIKNEYDCILVNFMVDSMNYTGGGLRVGWDQLMALWRGYLLQHPRVICTSFGDPYKLYEVPYMETYINAFSYTESTQKGFVKVLLGEVEPMAKNPVKLTGFFEREVE